MNLARTMRRLSVALCSQGLLAFSATAVEAPRKEVRILYDFEDPAEIAEFRGFAEEGVFVEAVQDNGVTSGRTCLRVVGKEKAPWAAILIRGNRIRDWANFEHFAMDVFSERSEKIGICFELWDSSSRNYQTRCTYEAQIDSTHRDPIRTGSLYGLCHVYQQHVKPDTWFTYELEVRDDVWRGRQMTRIKVTIDRNELYEYLDFAPAFKHRMRAPVRRAIAFVQPKIACQCHTGQWRDTQHGPVAISGQHRQPRAVSPGPSRVRRFGDADQRLQRIGLEHGPNPRRHHEDSGLLAHGVARSLPRLLCLLRTIQRPELIQPANPGIARFLRHQMLRWRSHKEEQRECQARKAEPRHRKLLQVME